MDIELTLSLRRRFPINKLGTLIGQVAQAWRGLDRIYCFVGDDLSLGLAPVRDDDLFQGEETKLLTFPSGNHDNASAKQDVQVSVTRGAFVRRSRDSVFVAGRTNRLELDLRRGQVAAVIGEVGCGKTTLVEGILGNVEAVDSDVTVHLRPKAAIAFAPQHPCILNATLRDNVLFGRAYDAIQYDLAIRASQLVEDIEGFPAGDLTEIGERGVTLSGGQKARVALARVVFSNPDVAILDDSLSALDAKTARAVFDGLFNKINGALRNAAVMLVTHDVRVAPRVSRTIVVDATGDIVFSGSWSEAQGLADSTGVDPNVQQVLKDLIVASNFDSHGDVDESCDKHVNGTDIETQLQVSSKPRSDAELRKAAASRLMSREYREEGTASLSTWLMWCRAAGGRTFLTVQILALAFDRAFYVGTEWWLARWADAREDGATIFGKRFPSQREGLRAKWRWARIYLYIGAASTFFCFLRTQWGFFCGVNAARHLYDAACARLLAAPISYFDSTPTGRIVSRMSYDAEQVDVALTQKAAMALISVGWAITGAIVMLSLSRGAMALILLPVSFVFYRLQAFYRQSSVDLQRLDAISRSPLQQQITEAVAASPSIRAFGVQSHFETRFFGSIDVNTEALLCWTAAQRWIGLRLDYLAAAVATFAAFLVATVHRNLELTESFAGMLMVWSFQLTITLMFLITTYSESENAVTSVERISEPVPNEFAPDDGKQLVLVDGDWPMHGDIVFDNVCLRYRPGLPLALDHLSFRVAAASRCGIVGR